MSTHIQQPTFFKKTSPRFTLHRFMLFNVTYFSELRNAISIHSNIHYYQAKMLILYIVDLNNQFEQLCWQKMRSSIPCPSFCNIFFRSAKESSKQASFFRLFSSYKQLIFCMLILMAPDRGGAEHVTGGLEEEAMSASKSHFQSRFQAAGRSTFAHRQRSGLPVFI